ncbi:L,D-transpeptidase [Microbacterium sp. MAHUQ-60]|uniref:L,D-transpeptidase n=1 Tax=unclassified Microbacterium TaxID=2609290 RepID=UPI0036070EDB
MTDLISGPDTGAVATDALPPSDGTQPVEWAPADPAPKKRHLGLWIGLGAGALVLAAAGASMILIAPGTTVAGVQIGGMTPGMAADAISNRIAGTEIELTGSDITVTGADLGATVDATALAEQAFADRPMWNLGSWMGDPIGTDVALDPDTAERTLRAAVPDSYVEPVDADVAFDAASGTYTVTPAQPGTGISVTDLASAFAAAASEGSATFAFPATATEVTANVTDADAATTAEKLNDMLTTIGFYVGDERTVPVEPAVAATWLDVEDVDGELRITADPAAIQSVVSTLPEQVNRPVVNAQTIVDSNGKVLKTLVAGADGRVLGDTTGIASAFAANLAAGNASFQLPVSSTPFETTSLFRRLEVDLSEQRAYAYENEKLVNSWAISSGKAGFETAKGRFHVYAQLRTQNMGRKDTSVAPFYYTPNVPYVTYFNGDEAFHGTYWHSNFGHPMSHGCVNMTTSAAKFVWEWATTGTDVWVHG